MSEFYSYEGIRDGATFVVDETTATSIQDAPTQIIGKVVAATGNGQAGYGSAGDAPLGFVEMVEKEVANSDNYVISVVWHQIREDIPCAGTETAGDWLACDGNGGVQKSTDCTGVRAIAVDTEGKLAIVQMY